MSRVKEQEERENLILNLGFSLSRLEELLYEVINLRDQCDGMVHKIEQINMDIQKVKRSLPDYLL